MERQSLFSAAGPLVLRAATLPHDVFDEFMANARTMPTIEQLHGYIQALADVPELSEAVKVSSPDLAGTLHKVQSGERISQKKALRTAISITRYARRMSSRATPFGLYAGTTHAEFTDESGVRTFSGAVKAVRPDAEWYDSLIRSWLSRPHVRNADKVVANNLCYVRGDRLIVPHVRAVPGEPRDDNALRPQEASLRNSPHLAWIRERASVPVIYSELLSEAVGRFPEAGRERLDAFLQNLLTHDVILSSLATPPLHSAGLDALAEALPQGSPEASQVRSMKGVLNTYASTPIGRGHEAWERLTEELRSIHQVSEQRASLVQVDLHAGVDVCLPLPVRDEVEAVASDLWRITAPVDAYANMRAYRQTFISKFGEHGAVRLKDLVDPHRGIGYPQGYTTPQIGATIGARRHAAHADDRVAALAELASRHEAGSTGEVVLSDEDVRALTVAGSRPSSLDVCMQLLSPSRKALSEGDYRLWMVPIGGTLTAGSMAGRFAHVTQTSADLEKVMARTDDEALVAQVDFRTTRPRSMNVGRTPSFLPHVIPVGTVVDQDVQQAIDWADLVVAADGDLLRIYWTRTGQEVFPIAAHVLGLTANAPALARLLLEMRFTGDAKIWQPWSWGHFASLPVLPRVRRGNTILAPRTWRVSSRLRQAAADRSGWDEAVAKWRQELDVTPVINVGQYDQLCEVDLDNALQREMFRREVTGGNIVVSETPATHEHGYGYGWLDGRSNELTVPLIPLRSNTSGLPDRPRRTLDERQIDNSVGPSCPPGGRWAYLELFCASTVHDEVISRHLPRIVQEVSSEIDRWFFIRYNQPSHHLRLRLRSKTEVFPAEAWEKVLQYCAELHEAGLIGSYSIPTYAPEYSRYGGVAGTDAAEELFDADSAWTVNILRSETAGRMPFSRELLTVIGYGLILDGLGSWDWPGWVTGTLPDETRHRPSREEVRTAAAVVVPQATLRNVAPLLAPGAAASAERLMLAAGRVGPHILADLETDGRWSWQDGMVAALLHMHHNRLVGGNREAENRSLTLLSHVARMHQGRARHLSERSS
ncbi:lantibiotic dehydratase [Streptomyces albidoflavus]|uniref:lantibiotic dehydratase n=1 Tax=Streptomyces TaxID=1883 RepID=UPI001FFFA984|nr:lantibiotic dehydratase [Streptomyces sp. WAC00276]MCK2141656.1 lantibiotic dehydratase [Streptomyces sp. WAC00276]